MLVPETVVCNESEGRNYQMIPSRKQAVILFFFITLYSSLYYALELPLAYRYYANNADTLNSLWLMNLRKKTIKC